MEAHANMEKTGNILL